MIEERLMAAGRWDLTMAEDTPQRILNELDPATNGYGVLVVTDAPVDARNLSASDLRSVARWAGVFRRREGLTISGAGLAILLGDEDDKGPIVDPVVSKSAATISTWLTDLLPQNGLTKGTVTTTSTNNVTASFQYVTTRKAIDALCTAAGAEWRVNPTLTVDAATPGNLFTAYTTPTAVVTRYGTGRRGAVSGIDPEDLATATHVEDYSTKVFYIARDTGEGAPTVSTATGTAAFKNPGGSDLVMARVIDSSGAAPADGANLAAAQLGRFDQATQGVDLSTREYDIPAMVRPGDRLWVYDPPLGLYDLANQVQRGGETLFPLAVRVYALSWPFRSGLGVYLLTPEASARVVDLTPYYVNEDQAASIEVGVAPRPVGGGGTVDLGFSSAVGDVPLISVLGGTYTPTLTASVTNPTLGSGSSATGTYAVDAAGWVSVDFLVQFGTSGTAAGSGTYRISLPETAAADGYWAGVCEATNFAGAPKVRFAQVSGSGTYVILYDTAGTAVAHNAPHAWAAQDYLRGTLRYRRA